MGETAVSLNFRKYDDRPGVFVDRRDGAEYARDDTDSLVLLYEDRVKGWFLDYGIQLKRKHDAAFVVLQIALAQIEGMEQYRQGVSSENQSSEFLRSGLKRIFSLNQSAEPWLKDFYKLVRCGLFHDGMTRRKVLIENRFPTSLEYDGTNIRVSPNLFLDAVVSDFESYVAELKDPANCELRRKFKEKWTGTQ